LSDRPINDPANLLDDVGTEFVRLRGTNRAAAWAYLQEQLMSHMGTLVPHVTSLKDMIGQNIEIELFLKQADGSKNMDPVEALATFLNAPGPTSSPTMPIVDDDEEDMIQ
jgi:hypothetical protein